MWLYWIMFLIPATAALGRLDTVQRMAQRAGPGQVSLVAAGVAFAFLVGLRFEVGGDWFNYLENFQYLKDTPLSEAMSLSDPGYQVLSWLCLQAGLSIVAVNFISAAIFAAGLTVFCLRLPRPWLALAVAVPYLVIVVGMGYSRQAVALGFAMLALAALGQASIARFVLLVLVGATFHRTAILLLPIAALVRSRNWWWTVLWVGLATVSAYYVLLADSVDDLYQNYVLAEYQSEGAFIRLLMNAVPAMILVAKRRRFAFPPNEARLWRWFAYISILLFVALFLTDASTALDRIGLYMLPLQMVVFSRLPDVVGSSKSRNLGWAGLILCYYAVVQFVWLNFATHAEFWLPYRFYPLEAVL